ncbi:MAG: histidine phosphatase family protein [Chloroflexota bacterium]|nr:histidine phosphatase family protein [Chloroflexota bacterium]
MNYLQEVAELRNTYFALRHGNSLANRAELIVSHPDDGVPLYGLSDTGKAQVASAVAAAKQQFGLDHTTIIVTSDFARARETAEIAATLLGVPAINTTPRLRERFFGAWDKQHTSNYEKVWSDDVAEPDHKHNAVESTSEVVARATALIKELEDTYAGRNILLVSHGDTLQILQTAFERVAASQHRMLSHLQTGEIRKLRLKASNSS